MRLLIIEDEKKTASFLHLGLSESGSVVDTSGDGDKGLLLALDIDYYLIILEGRAPRFG